MKLTEGLIRARSYIIFILGLIAAFGIVIVLENWKIEDQLRMEMKTRMAATAESSSDASSREVLQKEKIEKSPNIPLREPRRLTPREEEWARTAWRYFENNLHESTGMVDSVDGYPATTMWDTASYLMALIGAERLGIVDAEEFNRRLSSLLNTLAELPLFEGSLPNKSYNTLNAGMVDYNNQPAESGIGWSAIDVGRLLVPLNVIVWRYPSHTPEVKQILRRWRFDCLVRDAILYGTARDSEGRTAFLQEGRLGYEQYAAKSLALMGLDVSRALDYRAFMGWIGVYGVRVPFDLRDPEKYHAHNYVVSEPYILDGLEFGWDEVSGELAFRVFRAQEERFIQTGALTAVSEDHIDEPPFFVYNTVFTDGKVWNCITEKGEDASRFKSISTKAAFGWYALYRTGYSERLVERVSSLFDPSKGWYSGEYELDGQPNKAITCNTNAMVLESLCYMQFGRLIRIE